MNDASQAEESIKNTGKADENAAQHEEAGELARLQAELTEQKD